MFNNNDQARAACENERQRQAEGTSDNEYVHQAPHLPKRKRRIQRPDPATNPSNYKASTSAFILNAIAFFIAGGILAMLFLQPHQRQDVQPQDRAVLRSYAFTNAQDDGILELYNEQIFLASNESTNRYEQIKDCGSGAYHEIKLQNQTFFSVECSK